MSFLLVIAILIALFSLVRPLPEFGFTTRRRSLKVIGVLFLILLFVVSDGTKENLLVVFFFLSTLFGLVNIVRPIKTIGIQNRKTAAVAVMVSVGLMYATHHFFEYDERTQDVLLWYKLRAQHEAERKAEREKKEQVARDEKLKAENPEAYAKLMQQREQERLAEEARNAELARKEAEAEAIEEKQREEAKKEKKIEERPVRFKVTGWYKAGFDNIFMLNARITDLAPFPIKDVVVHCKVYSLSNTELGDVTGIIYRTIPPKKTIQVSDFNMGLIDVQSGRAKCRAITFSKVQ